MKREVFACFATYNRYTLHKTTCNLAGVFICGDCSAVAEHLTAQRSAIKMLVSRVRAVLATVRAMRDGALPPRPALLREARALANRLPLLTSHQFRTHFYHVCFMLAYTRAQLTRPVPNLIFGPRFEIISPYEIKSILHL